MAQNAGNVGNAGNVHYDSGECSHFSIPGMLKKIPGNVRQDSGQGY